MILLNNFFSIEERQEGRCKVSLNESHEIYKAHFPGDPITPGVCIVQMATEILQEMTGERLSVCEIKRIKYLGMVKPNDKPWFSFEPANSGQGKYDVAITVSDDEKTFTKMAVSYDVLSE